tara:strand:- start:418 stop:939 length:522 start_codon:yes stop_codon:yes gene_type:complete
VNGLIKTLIKPDWEDNPKRSEILHAANLLQIGEFQLIQLAYKAWYEKNLPEEKINKIFSEYMISEIIPIWVTYYARDIIKIERANALNSHDKKYHVYDHEFGTHIHDDKQRKRRGIFYTAIIAFAFITSHYMAANYVSLEEPADLFPPYVEKSIAYPELYKKDSGYGLNNSQK